MATPSQRPRGTRALLTEIVIVVLGVEAVTLAVTLLPMAWPVTAPYQGVVIALAFLYAPVLADRWVGERPLPVPRGAALRSLTTGLLVAALVLPLFALGNHVFQRHVRGREFLGGSWAERLKDWPAEWEGRPASVDGDLPRIWVDAGLLVVANPPSAPAEARIDWTPIDGASSPRFAAVVGDDLREVGDVVLSPHDLPPGGALVFRARGLERISVEGTSKIHAGATAARRDAPRDLHPGWTWWLWILASLPPPPGPGSHSAHSPLDNSSSSRRCSS